MYFFVFCTLCQQGDLVKLITLATDTICADESTRIAEKETKSNIYSLRSDKMAADSDVHHNRTKTLRKNIELQSGEGSLDKPYQPNEKSDVSSRLLEIKREYARNFYTKTAEQKGLALIFGSDRNFFYQPGTVPLQEFFEEIGFVVKFSGKSDRSQLLKDMTDGNFYCVFIVTMSNEEYEDVILIRHLLSHGSIGKPVIIMTDSTFYFPHIREHNDILIVQPIMQISRGPYGYDAESYIFDHFVKATRRNRFADIMDILTRMNALYDFPNITFQSTLKKKFCFL